MWWPSKRPSGRKTLFSLILCVRRRKIIRYYLHMLKVSSDVPSLISYRISPFNNLEQSQTVDEIIGNFFSPTHMDKHLFSAPKNLPTPNCIIGYSCCWQEQSLFSRGQKQYSMTISSFISRKMDLHFSQYDVTWKVLPLTINSLSSFESLGKHLRLKVQSKQN